MNTLAYILLYCGGFWLLAAPIILGFLMAFTPLKLRGEHQTLKYHIIPSVIAIVLAIIMFASTTPSSSGNDYYSDVFQKNPNNWSEDEKEYVNNFFEWQAKNY